MHSTDQNDEHYVCGEALALRNRKVPCCGCSGHACKPLKEAGRVYLKAEPTLPNNTTEVVEGWIEDDQEKINEIYQAAGGKVEEKIQHSGSGIGGNDVKFRVYKELSEKVEDNPWWHEQFDLMVKDKTENLGSAGWRVAPSTVYILIQEIEARATRRAKADMAREIEEANIRALQAGRIDLGLKIVKLINPKKALDSLSDINNLLAEFMKEEKGI